MSMDLYVLYDGAPFSLIEWQKNVDRLQFEMSFLPGQTMPLEGTMIRAAWKGRDVSFECWSRDFETLIETYDDIDFGQKWDTVYAFYFSGLPDCVAACIAAVALAQMRDGIVFDPQDSHIMRDQEALHMARETERLLPKIEASLRN